MNKKTLNWTKYIFTSFITFIILSIIVCGYFVYDTVFSYHVTFETEEEIPQELIMYKIDNDLKQIPDYWDNAKICYKIGTLYERIYLFDLAAKYYYRAIECSNKNYYAPHFKLARLNLARNKLDAANQTIELIPKINNKKIKYKKGVFYNDLAVAFMKADRLSDAIIAIKKAMLYFKTTDKKKYKEVEKEYIYLLAKKTEILINQGKYSEAVKILEFAQKKNKSAELQYRLGILYFDNDNEKALYYFEKTKKLNPALINYNLYYNLLNKLINEANKKNDSKKVKIYTQKLENLTHYIGNHFQFQNEFKIENLIVRTDTKLWGIKKYIIIKFDIYNNTRFTYNNIFVDVLVDTGGEKFKKTILVGKQQEVILPFSYAKNVHTKINISRALINKNDKITGSIYLYKNRKFNKIKLGEFSL